MIIHAGPTCGKSFLQENFSEEGVMDTDLVFEAQFPEVWEKRLKMPRDLAWKQAVAKIGEDARAWSAAGGLVVTNLRDHAFWNGTKPGITVFRQPAGMVKEFERRAEGKGKQFDKRAWTERANNWFADWCESTKSGSWAMVPSVILSEGEFLLDVTRGKLKPRVSRKGAGPFPAFAK